MKCTVHGFTWDLDGSQSEIFKATRHHQDPAARVAAIILATGQLPVAAEKEFDAELEAWRVNRFQIAGPYEASWLHTQKQMQAMMPFLLDEDQKAVMRAVLSVAGCRIGESPARTELFKRGWISSYESNGNEYFTVGPGYITHLERMVTLLLKRDGAMPIGEIRGYLIDGDELLIAMQQLCNRGVITWREGSWHLL